MSAREVAADVQVCWINLQGMSVDRYLLHLSREEHERVQRLRREVSRVTFAVTRAVLRRLLAAQLDVSAHALSFAEGRYGKPWLPDYPALEFNVAHTDGLAVVALSRRGPIGVDVERLEPRVPVEGLARRWFSPAEMSAFRELSDEDRLRGFFDAWARKEAFVKALGTGLSHDIGSFSVTVQPGEPGMLYGPPARRWKLIDLDAGPAYAAALVVRRGGTEGPIREFAWSEE